MWKGHFSVNTAAMFLFKGARKERDVCPITETTEDGVQPGLGELQNRDFKGFVRR